MWTAGAGALKLELGPLVLGPLELGPDVTLARRGRNATKAEIV